MINANCHKQCDLNLPKFVKVDQKNPNKTLARNIVPKT